MTRKEEVINGIISLNERLDKVSNLSLDQEQITNVILSSILKQLGDMNEVLAWMPLPEG